ncbi:MAG: cation:proton antiporter [Acidobacteria bacterium]|nr:cation:proton antiporter [Acidobacteriota bacterium]MDA1234017.1 cation:proton antiporter [Acidobacteriota bacterium]
MINTPHDSVIVQSSGRFLIPLIQLFGLYVLFFGQYGPGGGFVGGVLLGASLIAGLLIFGPDGTSSETARRVLKIDGFGLIIFAGIGGLCLIGGGEFLNYSSFSIPGIDDSTRRHVGIIVAQIGVALDIAVAAVSIVYSLSDQGEDGSDA